MKLGMWLALCFMVVGAVPGAAQIIAENSPDQLDAWRSDLEEPVSEADDFVLTTSEVIDRVEVWGVYQNGNPVAVDEFRVRFLSDSAGLPGALACGNCEWSDLTGSRVATGNTVAESGADQAEYLYVFDLSSAMLLPAGTFWLEVFNNTPSNGTGIYDAWRWVTSGAGSGSHAYAYEAPGTSWTSSSPALSYRLSYVGVLFGDGFETGETSDWSSTNP